MIKKSYDGTELAASSPFTNGRWIVQDNHRIIPTVNPATNRWPHVLGHECSRLDGGIGDKPATTTDLPFSDTFGVGNK